MVAGQRQPGPDEPPLKEPPNLNDATSVPIDVVPISVSGYRRAMRKSGAQMFAITLHEEAPEPKQQTNPREKIPKQHHQYLHVASEEAANELPPHCQYDHRI